MNSSIHWPDAANTNLWQMAVNYAMHHHNHMPHPATGMIAPIDLLLKNQVSYLYFQDMHNWGCPCYILDPKL